MAGPSRVARFVSHVVPSSASAGAPPSPLSAGLSLPCGLQLPNRLFKPAMTEGQADEHNHPTDKLIWLYEQWSGSGCGLLLTGNIMVDRRFLERPGNVAMDMRFPWHPPALEKARAWVRAAKAGGAVVFAQLGHPGQKCNPLVNAVLPSASAGNPVDGGGSSACMPEEEVREIPARFAHAARLCKEAGFDGVQIHSTHGYLLNQFLSPIYNRRDDRWGGSLPDRASLLLAVLRGVREAVGPEYAVSVRLPVSEMRDDGLRYRDIIQVARWASEHGAVDLLDLSGDWAGMFATAAGRPNPDPPAGADPAPPAEGSFLNYVGAMKRELPGLPLITASKFETKAAMEAAVAAEATDCVGIGRALVGPDWGGPLRDMMAAPASSAPSVRSIGPTNSMRDLRWIYWQMHLACNGLAWDREIGLKDAHESLEAKEREWVGRYHDTFPADAVMWAHPNPRAGQGPRR